jgi:hypothetical protein
VAAFYSESLGCQPFCWKNLFSFKWLAFAKAM